MPNRDPYFKRFFSLWAIIYVLIFIASSQFSPEIKFLQGFVIWFGKNIMHLPKLEKIQMTGSGDTTYDYVLLTVIFFLSALLAVAVSAMDYKRQSYRPLYLFTIVIARYYLAFSMLVYGFAKVFDGQFGPLSYYSLEQRLGEMSPMGVLWNFMETSRAYTFFGGLMEVIGGTLLLFRKTKTIGALFSMTVMINVAMMNFTYDVPVKIFSSHLVLLSFFILSFEWQKLYNFFILHKQEILDFNRFKIKKRWMYITLRSLKVLFIGLLLYQFFISPLINNVEQKLPLEGHYKTQLFILNNDTIPENINDTVRWNKMVIAYEGGINVVRQENTFSWYNSEVDTVKQIMTLKKNDDSVNVYASLHYDIQKDTVRLTGKVEDSPATMVFIRKLRKDYPLINRGFHWINEYPYNR